MDSSNEHHGYLTWYIQADCQNLGPAKSSDGDLSYDFKTPIDIVIPAKSNILVDTLVSAILPLGYGLVLATRSSYAAKKRVTVEGGIIDNGYRGNIKVVLYNHSEDDVHITAGDRIAQGYLQKIYRPSVSTKYGQAPQDTDRGSHGFGSTGE